MSASSTLQLLGPPYTSILDATRIREATASGAPRGGRVLVWYLEQPIASDHAETARHRPPGVALIVVLPTVEQIRDSGELVSVVEQCRPHSILPHLDVMKPHEIRSLLSRPPDDLPMEITDYLLWRGLSIDLETRRLIRKTFELAGEVTTINSLSRALYLSRRALGRRFSSRGLPVPSHWLHLARVLRSAIHLQDSAASLFSAATAFGYPDGFALSNQMHRLTGVRPSVARECLGWEWLFEAWLEKEARGGGFSLDGARTLGYGVSSKSPRRVADPPSVKQKRPARSTPRTTADTPA